MRVLVCLKKLGLQRFEIVELHRRPRTRRTKIPPDNAVFCYTIYYTIMRTTIFIEQRCQRRIF